MNSVNKKVLHVIIVVMLVSCCAQRENTITVSGAWALYPLMVKWAEEYSTQHPDVRIEVSAGGAGKGMADTLGGLCDIGMISRKIYPEEIEKGAFWMVVAKDAVVPIINRDNPYCAEILSRGMTKDMFYRIYREGAVTWGEILGNPAITDTPHVYTRSDACGAAQTWALYLGVVQEDLQGVGVYGDPGIVEAVARDVYSIGYANLNFAYDIHTGEPAPHIRAVPIDLDNNKRIDDNEAFYTTKSQVIDAIASGGYPSPPARELYVVTKGKPEGIVKDFLIWILTEGQQFIPEIGYVPVENLDEEVKKVEG